MPPVGRGKKSSRSASEGCGIPRLRFGLRRRRCSLSRQGNAILHLRAEMAEVLAHVHLRRSATRTAAAAVASRATAARFAAAVGLVTVMMLLFVRRRHGEVFQADRQTELRFEGLCEIVSIGVFAYELQDRHLAVEE